MKIVSSFAVGLGVGYTINRLGVSEEIISMNYKIMTFGVEPFKEYVLPVGKWGVESSVGLISSAATYFYLEK